MQEAVVDSLFEALNLEHLSLASTRIVSSSATAAAATQVVPSTSRPWNFFRSRHDEKKDVVMEDEPFAGRSGHRPESALLSLDLSGIEGLPDDQTAMALSGCRRLVALRLSASSSCPATMAQVAMLPHLAHLELSTATPHWQPPINSSLSAALGELCSKVATRTAALADSPPPPNAILESLPDHAPWWRPSAQTSHTSPQTSSSSYGLQASLHPESPFHLVLDFPIITSNPRAWLTEAFASIPFRALTIRHPQLADTAAPVTLASSHSIPCSRNVPVLPGPATLAAQATPDAARALHALLPDLLIGHAPLSHFQLLGVEITEAVIRHMRMVQSQLGSLCLHNRDPEAPARPPLSSHRSSLDCDDSCAADKPDVAVQATPVSPSELRARMAARWRLPAAATLRQLVDSQGSAHLHRLELIDLPGMPLTTRPCITAVTRHRPFLQLSQRVNERSLAVEPGVGRRRCSESAVAHHTRPRNKHMCGGLLRNMS